MMWTMLMSKLLVVAVLVGLIGAKSGPFSGHKVIRVVPQTEGQLKRLNQLLQTTSHLDVWLHPSRVNSPVDVRLSPFDYDDVTNALHRFGLHPEDFIDDVQSLIDSQWSTSKSNKNSFDYSKYHRLDEIYAWLQHMSKKFKRMTSLLYVTKSFEGRPLLGIKISTKRPQIARKPAFWMMGGMHAREWISPATVIYMTSQLLSQYKVNPAITNIVDKFDWYILPVTNPDGYAFTWTSQKNRFWRKTRSKHGRCVGVDPNRNWDDNWCKNGASKDPCSDAYCGPSPFSEVEVKGVADFLTNIRNVSCFIDFHSYSQLWMSPWGYTKKIPKDFKVQDAAAKAACDALLKVNGTKYWHGTTANIIYEASGISIDWVYDVLGTKFSYGVELRDTGNYGFLLPEDQILPSGAETLEAVRALAEFILNQGE